jgi:hypothetical protein
MDRYFESEQHLNHALLDVGPKKRQMKSVQLKKKARFECQAYADFRHGRKRRITA